ncbi:MAG: YlbF family regulator [Clostridiales Family XIII bacterium]|jgi:cell fate (sporulation/competence/biofilm development) regulator YlbF (YheA/YmcA/DUF963 family)|nr:YlbF family regulator [Clostridiales Family XIII bacterium]
MQNIHDIAHTLAIAIRNSEEYAQYIDVKERAGANPDLADSLNDFHEKQFELQRKQLLGEDLTPDTQIQMQNVAQILMRDPLAAEYLQAEVRFTLMVNDVYSIIAEAIKTE